MRSLIVVGTGDDQRRCDSKCYDASSEDCDCVCGGINHGMGLRAAEYNTERMAASLKKQYARQGKKIDIPTKQARRLDA